MKYGYSDLNSKRINKRKCEVAHWMERWQDLRCSNPCTRKFLVRIAVNSMTEKFSPLKLQILQKFTAKVNANLQKFAAFTAFTAKRCRRLAVKNFNFHRYSPQLLKNFSV